MKALIVVLLFALPASGQNDYGTALLNRLSSKLRPMAKLTTTGGPEHEEVMRAYTIEMMQLFGSSVVTRNFARQLTSALWSKPLNSENLLPLNRAALNAFAVAVACRKQHCQLGKSEALRAAADDFCLSLRMIGVSKIESLMVTEQLLRACDLVVKGLPGLYLPADPS